ncbi:hypothetical protein ACOMHN_036197 [Nucella lapillus]
MMFVDKVTLSTCASFTAGVMLMVVPFVTPLASGSSASAASDAVTTVVVGGGGDIGGRCITISCQVLNSTCSALVVSLSSTSRAQSFKNWAAEHVIPYVIVAGSLCPMTSSEVLTPFRREPVMIQQLLSYLGWTQVAVLVDSRKTDSSASAQVVQKLSDVYMGTLVFRLFEHLHVHLGNSEEFTLNASQHVREHLRLIKESRFSTILVKASPSIAELILREARKMKLLSREHYWVIALSITHRLDLLRSSKVKGANILIVHPLAHIDQCPACHCLTTACWNASTPKPKPTMMAEAVESLVRAAVLVSSLEHALYDSENSSICEKSREALHHSSDVMRELEEVQKRKAQEESSETTAFGICSTQSGTQGGLVKVGRWSGQSGLQVIEDQLFMNSFRDFGYMTLRVGTQEAKPFVQRIGNSSMFEGFCIDILIELASALKFKYEFVEPSDGEWGAPKKDNSGNWTGIVQLVRAQEVDFGIGPFTITSIREEVIDFTKPFMEDGVGILTKRPDSDAQNMFKMFTPLTPLVWGAVAGAVVVVSVSLYMIERLSPFSARNLEGDRTLGFLGSVWLIYGSYMEQGGDPHPRSVSARFLVGFWWLFTILMTSTYTANLAAFLTVTIEETPINSLSELAASADLKPLVKTGSNVMTLFQEAEGGIYQQIWSKMSGEMPVVKSNLEAQGHVEGGSYAYMTDASQLEYIMLKDCTTYSVAKELFNTGGFGFVLQEDSPYMDVINYNIMKMQEAGLMDKWRHRWWSSKERCTSAGRTSAAKELDWPSLSGLFYIFLVVTAVAVVLRVLEIWIQADKFITFWNRVKSVMHFAAAKDSKISNHHRSSAEAESDSFEHAERRSGRTTLQENSSVRRVESSAAELAFDGPFSEEDRRRSEDHCSTVNERYKMEARSFRGTRSPEFQDFDSEHYYWEPHMHRSNGERQTR